MTESEPAICKGRANRLLALDLLNESHQMIERHPQMHTPKKKLCAHTDHEMGTPTGAISASIIPVHIRAAYAGEPKEMNFLMDAPGR